MSTLPASSGNQRHGTWTGVLPYAGPFSMVTPNPMLFPPPPPEPPAEHEHLAVLSKTMNQLYDPNKADNLNPNRIPPSLVTNLQQTNKRAACPTDAGPSCSKKMKTCGENPCDNCMNRQLRCEFFEIELDRLERYLESQRKMLDRKTEEIEHGILFMKTVSSPEVSSLIERFFEVDDYHSEENGSKSSILELSMLEKINDPFERLFSLLINESQKALPPAPHTDNTDPMLNTISNSSAIGHPPIFPSAKNSVPVQIPASYPQYSAPLPPHNNLPYHNFNQYPTPPFTEYSDASNFRPSYAAPANQPSGSRNHRPTFPKRKTRQSNPPFR